MRICYVVLSPTFGMHQSTADLANLQAAPEPDGGSESPNEVTVVTMFGAPVDRYAPQIAMRPIVSVRGTGLQRTNINLRSLWKVYRAIVDARPAVVHFNSPHIWNPILLFLLRRARIHTVQTIHDLDPHSGTGYGRLLYIWNNLVIRLATHILVHGQIYRARLIERGVKPDRITCIPLLHLFLSYANVHQLESKASVATLDRINPNEVEPFALFFARLEAYKGVDVLIEAMRQIETQLPRLRAIIAGEGNIQHFAPGKLPANIQIRNRLIKDDEAIDLFRQCSLVVLPYVDATQSALIASAYFFGKPVIVTRTGALPEYVIAGETGWVIKPRNPQALAECLLAAFSDSAQLVEMGKAGQAWYQTQRHQAQLELLAMYRQTAALRPR